VSVVTSPWRRRWVEPVDVGHCCELDVVETRPWSLPVDQLPLVEPVERLGKGVVAVAFGADGGDDGVLGEAFGVADGQIGPPDRSAERAGTNRRRRVDG